MRPFELKVNGKTIGKYTKHDFETYIKDSKFRMVEVYPLDIDETARLHEPVLTMSLGLNDLLQIHYA